jgi:hypothetical protein
MKIPSVYRLLILGLALHAVPRWVPAQLAAGAMSAEESQHRTFGTSDTIILQIPSAAFQVRGGQPIQELNYGYLHALGTAAASFVAPLVLPNGALVNFLDLYYYDTDAGSEPFANDVYATLFQTAGTSPPTDSTVAQVFSSGSAGYGYSFKQISPPLQIDNTKRYLIYVYNCWSADKAFGGVNVWYRLQMSPAPGTATFGDVPTNHTYFRAIEALAASGITGGCGSGNFCPSQFVTRGEMAAFLARALGLHWPY